MTAAEKALGDIIKRRVRGITEDEFLIIKKALQRAAECEKAHVFARDNITELGMQMEHLKAKSQGLLKALKFYKKHAAKHSLDGICNCPTRKVAAEAIAAFKSDERGTT